MTIHLLDSKATPEQMAEMLQTLKTYVKLAVDIKRGVLAGGGVMHADCEAVLIEDGSQQEDIWGADLLPATQQIRYESLINIRSRQHNPSMVIMDSVIRDQVDGVVVNLLGGV